jgi:hypothetical protein
VAKSHIALHHLSLVDATYTASLWRQGHTSQQE